MLITSLPFLKRELEIYVLGNGPSRAQFVPVKDVPIYGCNLSDFSLPITASFIMDASVIGHIHNNSVLLPFPIVIPSALKRITEQCPVTPKVLYYLDDGSYNGENGGHHAVINAMLRYEKVNLIGFDSMFIDSIESDTHQKIKNSYVCPTNYKKWRTNWDQILNSSLASTCDISIWNPKINQYFDK